jgi:hypothetical protein
MRICVSNFASENIEWFVEDQALLRSYDLDPPPPVSATEKERQLADVEGGGGKSYGHKKPGPLWII